MRNIKKLQSSSVKPHDHVYGYSGRWFFSIVHGQDAIESLTPQRTQRMAELRMKRWMRRLDYEKSSRKENKE